MWQILLSSLNTSGHFIPATLGGGYYKYFDFADKKKTTFLFFFCFFWTFFFLPPVFTPFAQQQLLNPW